MNLESLRRRLSSDEINALPLCHYEGPIHLVRSLEDWEKALPDLQQEQVLGFDTETRPSFRKGRVNTPSLVQLATARAVYLVQLSWWPLRELARLYPFKPAGMVDLGMVARAHQLTTQGLRTLAANLFGQRISKGPQCSNWSVMELSKRQVIYAATDAWIGRAIYLRMRELGMTGEAA
ncbi:MAG: 3'-5' exonuclease [Desulfovibrio piger]|uniref:3'-5' exonuclease n=1 Tax=Desulfovibrio piger TaxID=901 RepID=UPI000965597C|nr:3'-5' exonuclease [Desulfovibrio piger]OLA83067.1 MAG: 3'-5' exonuclease [Desulfovibrio piger]